MEIRKEVNLNLIDKPLNEDLMLAISHLIRLNHVVSKLLKVCPSPGIVSDTFDKHKIKVEEAIATVKKTYGWD